MPLCQRRDRRSQSRRHHCAWERRRRPPLPVPRIKVIDSLFANNKKLAGTGTGARVEFADIDPSFLEMSGTKISDQAVVVELDPAKRNYPHPAAGSEAANIGAGLFLKPAV